MKVVLLAGGAGTRLSEETDVRPKPMVRIGNEPIIWHIMKLYSFYGFNDFIVCTGYKGEVIKEYFMNYFYNHSDVTVETDSDRMWSSGGVKEKWKVSVVATGENTSTGGRIRRVERYLEDSSFMVTYGDGVSDVNIGNLLDFHKKHRKMATLTAVQPAGRFGQVYLNDQQNVIDFKEKPPGDGGWINAGYYVFSRDVINMIEDDSTVLESGPLSILSEKGELLAYRHLGFWKPMDTLNDKRTLEQLWKSRPPWVIWNE